jgi:P63C domain
LPFPSLADCKRHFHNVERSTWEEFGRLTNWEGPLHARPKWWGKLVIELIYDTLDPTVAKWLKENKPPLGFKWHQQLTENYGARKLVSRCYEIIGMAKTCHTIQELRQKVAEQDGKEPVQLTLYLPRGEGRKLEDGEGLLRAAEALAGKDE